MTTTHTIDVEAERETIGADKTFQNLLDEVGAAACDAWACGRDFGTAGKLADAESALIAHIDARLASERSIQPTIAAEDVRDAARYRWLCEKADVTKLPVLVEWCIAKDGGAYVEDGKANIDSAIDAAIAATTATQQET